MEREERQKEKQTYRLHELHCAHCAGKIEEEIKKQNWGKIQFHFMTKTVYLWLEEKEDKTQELQAICDAIEEGVLVEKIEEPSVQIFLIEGLHCAHCAGKIEEAIRALPEVEDIQLSMETKKVRIKCTSPTIEATMQAIADRIEPGVRFIKEEGTNTDGYEKKKGNSLREIGVGALLFFFSEYQSWIGEPWTFYMAVIAYLILGWRILYLAIRNVVRGRMLDENFLMAIATVGACVIGAYEEAVGVMLFYRIGEYFEERAVEKSRKQIMATAKLRPDEVLRIEGNQILTIPIEQVQVGDRLQIRPGDRIPVDGRIVQGEGKIDTAPITGEPVPLLARPGVSVYSGSLNIESVLVLEAEKQIGDSTITKVLESVENAAATKPKMDRFIRRFAKVYTPIVVALALVTAIIPPLLDGQWYHWLYTAMTFLVISCPCALVLSVPLTFFAGIGAASKMGILFKSGLSLETLKTVKAIVLDKTGTLTKGSFTVQQIVPEQGVTEEGLLLLCASMEQQSTHPIARSLVEEGKKRNLTLLAMERVQEESGKGIIAYFAQDELLCGTVSWLEEKGIAVPIEKRPKETAVYVGINGQYAGYLTIGDEIKEDAKEALHRLHEKGLQTIMLTGDTKDTAQYVGETLGIKEIHSTLLPHQKLEKLKECRKKYGPVLFVGDGINDAPVLANADVGSAMGSGADAAMEAADIVFMNNQVMAIPKAWNLAMETQHIAWQNISFAIGIKVLVMVLGLVGYASMWAAVFADTGVAVLCVANGMRLLYKKIK